MPQIYNDPAGGNDSSIGKQFRTDHYIKRALIEARKEMYFGQLSGVTNMPKNMGKKIKKYHYLPLLDDANMNDQGIDASGAVIDNTRWSAWNGQGVLLGDNFIDEVTALSQEGANIIRQNSGNLYGSSKDVGVISSKLPTLSETGGRVNRVGFTRKEVEGTMEKFGFFDEYTQESVDFDSDAELQMHIHREMLNGAMEMTEDALMVDLMNSAGVVRFAGTAAANIQVSDEDTVVYGDLLRLSIDLDNNRTPKQTKVITGTRRIDTKTLPAARVMFIGSELIPTIEGLTDSHGNPAFIPVQKYAAATTILNGEIGSVSNFRIVVVPEMGKWSGAGSPGGGSETHYESGNNFDIFPMLVVGEGSFTTIGFQTDGKSTKFKITHKPPGEATADRNDPYGETGFMSIKWWYGFLLERSERIAVIKTAAIM